MTDHVNLTDAELHEPKGMQTLTGGAADIGKVVVSKGDGTSEVRKLNASEVEGLDEVTSLVGTFFDDNRTTSTLSVATEGKHTYMIGAGPTQVVSVQLPSPSTYTGVVITLKRLDSNYGDGSQVKFVPNAAETIEGSAELLLKLADTSVSVISDGTDWRIVHDLYPVKPLFGWWDYNDTGTSGTPLNLVAGVPQPLPNNELGVNTNKTFRPIDTTDIWNAAGGVFDWTELSLGDTVDLRPDITVTTTTANQRVQVYLQLGQGGSPYNIPFIDTIVKAASTIQGTRFSGIYMGNANTLNNPAQFIIVSDAAATVVVNGWYVRVVGTKATY